MDIVPNAMSSGSWDYFLQELTVPERVKTVKDAVDLKDKIQICLLDPLVHKTLSNFLAKSAENNNFGKSASQSIQFRQKGNEKFENGDKDDALSNYSSAVKKAPSRSEELRLAYGNRSYALFQMGELKAAANDIDRALNGESAELRRIKLYTRKGKCLMDQKKFDEAEEAWKNAKSVFQNLRPELQQKMKKTLIEIDTYLNIKNKIGNAKRWNDDSQSFPDLNFVENTSFSCASAALSLHENTEKGRHVIAKRRIRAGDVLFVERPFAFVILAGSRSECHNCCKTSLCLIPCDNCAEACFCSESCKRSANSRFHVWECGLGLDVCYKIGIAHLGLRVALEGLHSPGDRYQPVLQLVSHLDDMDPQDLCKYTLTASLLTVYLDKYTDILSGGDRQSALVELGGRILLHIGQLVCNGHAITSVQMRDGAEGEGGVVSEEQVRVATGIFPSASMMNHSCDPNIINSFFDDVLIVKAVRSIEEGEEIFNCYGPNYRRQKTADRREALLKQYLFKCPCVRCEEGQDPPGDALLCPSCIRPMQLCDHNLSQEQLQVITQQLTRASQLFHEGTISLELCRYSEALNYLAQSHQLQEKILEKENDKLLQCKDLMAKTYIHLGEIEKGFYCLCETLPELENKYGGTSIEVAHEILKLLDVALCLIERNKILSEKHRSVLRKATEYGEKGKFIFSLLYGNWHKKYVEISHQLSIVKRYV